jgi:hypothetical protein
MKKGAHKQSHDFKVGELVITNSNYSRDRIEDELSEPFPRTELIHWQVEEQGMICQVWKTQIAIKFADGHIEKIKD